VSMPNGREFIGSRASEKVDVSATEGIPMNMWTVRTALTRAEPTAAHTVPRSLCPEISTATGLRGATEADYGQVLSRGVEPVVGFYPRAGLPLERAMAADG